MGLRLLRAAEAGLLIVALAACKGGDDKGKGKANEATRPSGSRAEVQAVFTELQARQEMHLVENGSYLAAKSGDDGWKTLGVEPVTEMTCAYEAAVDGDAYTLTARCADSTYTYSSKDQTLQQTD